MSSEEKKKLILLVQMLFNTCNRAIFSLVRTVWQPQQLILEVEIPRAECVDLILF